jgi:hypothetical protein
MTYDIFHQDNPAKSNFPKKRRTKSERAIFDFLDVRCNPVYGEMSLWSAVIMQALTDAINSARTAEDDYHKQEALRWLTGNGRDFHAVCMMAGFDPDWVRTRIKKALVGRRPWRASPGRGRRYVERKRYRERVKQSAHDNAGGVVLPSKWALA